MNARRQDGGKLCTPESAQPSRRPMRSPSATAPGPNVSTKAKRIHTHECVHEMRSLLHSHATTPILSPRKQRRHWVFVYSEVSLIV